MIAKVTHLFCILMVEAHGQTIKSDTACVGDAIVVPADSFYQPIRSVRPSFPDYVDFEVSNPNGEKVSVLLSDVKGDSALTKHFSHLPPKRYILSFAGIHCPGVYFVRFTIGDHTFTRSVALLQQSSPDRSDQPMKVDFESSVADGVWEKSYSQLIFPSISVPEERPAPDTVFHQIVLHLFGHTYEVEWITQGRGSGMQTEKYKGRFVINADTIKLLDAQTDKFYQFHVNSDTLSLNLFRKPTEPNAVHSLHPYSPTLILEGVYRRRNLQR